MKRSIAVVFGLCVTSLASQDAWAIPVLEDKENDRSLNVGALLQPQLQFTQDGAPNGHSLDTEIFLRRIRAIVSGQVTKGLTFYLQIDQPNLNKGGNFDVQLFMQAAVVSYEFAREFSLDGGLMLEPTTHNTLQGAGALHTIDYHLSSLIFPSNIGKTFADTGIEARGLLFNDRVHYRLGVFEGARGPALPAGTMGAAPINEDGEPRLTGQVRLNILGVEDKTFLSGYYFTDKPLFSIGVAGDFQRHAVRVGTGVANYSAVNADLFLEYPFPGDSEVMFVADVADWQEGSGATQTAISGFGELGYRYHWIEPLVSTDFVHAEQSAFDFFAIRPGVNFWLRKHAANIKAEAAWSSAWKPATGHDREFVTTVQGQVYF